VSSPTYIGKKVKRYNNVQTVNPVQYDTSKYQTGINSLASGMPEFASVADEFYKYTSLHEPMSQKGQSIISSRNDTLTQIASP